MGRSWEGDDCEEDGPPGYGRWMARVKAVLNGRPAQKHFQELEEALLAMPVKRLIQGSLCQRWETCAVGEMAVHKRVKAGMSRRDALTEVKRSKGTGKWQEEETAYNTAEFAERDLGMTNTLGWLIGEANDEKFYGLSPEERWERMLAWTRSHIREAQPA